MDRKEQERKVTASQAALGKAIRAHQMRTPTLELTENNGSPLRGRLYMRTTQHDLTIWKASSVPIMTKSNLVPLSSVLFSREEAQNAS